MGTDSPGTTGSWGRARLWLAALTVRQWLLAAFLLVLAASFPFGGLRAEPAETTPTLSLGAELTVEPVRLTVTKVRYGSDLGVPQAAKIDGRYVVVFAKVSGTDEKRSVPMYDALRDLLRIEQVAGVTKPFGTDPQASSDDLRPDTHSIDRSDQAIALAAMLLAAQVGVRAIVALTESGATAQWLSRYRTAIPIYALSPLADARRRMLLLRDVQPVAFSHEGLSSAATARAAVQQLFAQDRLSEGDRVVLTHGDHVGQGGGTNTLKLLSVGAEGMVESLRDL